MTRVRQIAHPRGLSHTTIRSNYPNRKVSLKVNRRTRIKVRRA